MTRSPIASRRIVTLSFAWLFVGTALLTGLWGEPAETRGELNVPGANDREVTRAVAALMRTYHLSRHPLDGEIADRAVTQFLKGLDPWKLYFFQSDVDKIQAQRDELVRQIRLGDITLGYEVYKTFLKRVDERLKLAEEFLQTPQDFTVDESMIADPDLTKYARNEAEAREMWRKRIKYDLLVLKDAGKKPADASQPPKDPKKEEDPVVRLRRRYQSFAKRMHQTDNDELLEMYLTALTTSYDPHSTYMSPSTVKNFDIIMSLHLEGIGAQLQFEDGYTVVNKIIPGGAAAKDGRLKAEDRIVGVGQGLDGDIVDVVDMKLSDVVEKIRGARGTIVRLEVIPFGSAEKKTYDITRAQIELRDSEARGEVIEENRGGRKYRVGVIDLPSFYMDMEGARMNRPDYKSTTRDVSKLLDDFRAKQVDAVILDLRHNGGGSLTEAISLTGLFVDQGPIVQVKDKDARTQQYNDMEAGTRWDGPLVVLTSKFSASASEIFAGAIQDYERGLIVGDKSTHGKGTVQSLLNLGERLFQIPNPPEMGALKVTMQQFYRPNGDSTQNRGVQADVVLPSLTNELDVGEADLDYAVAFDRIKEVAFNKLHMVDRAVVDRLNRQSQERQKSSTDFQKVLRNIARYHEQKAKKQVTLNEAKFLAEREELNVEKEQEKSFDDLNNPNRPVVDRNYYFNEALAITLDYMDQMKVAAAN